MLWYPKTFKELCKRNDCLYHSQHFLYSCDYCYLTEKSKTLAPGYERKNPTTEGCSMFAPRKKGYRKQKSSEWMYRELKLAHAAKLLRKLYPYLYEDDFDKQ